MLLYCCSIKLNSQSEHSGLRPDTSSLVIKNQVVFKKGKVCLIVQSKIISKTPVRTTKMSASCLSSCVFICGDYQVVTTANQAYISVHWLLLKTSKHFTFN